MNFNINEAIKTANQALSSKFNRNLTDIEIVILKGAWDREDYDTIAAKNQYATTYISQDVAPKLWKILTDALGEKVKKSNFKEALKRHWEENLLSQNNQPQPSHLPKLSSESTESQKITNNKDSQTEEQEIDNLDFYVERPPIESLCYEHILQPGSLLRVKAPSLMGKTCLMTRVLSLFANQGYQTVNLGFELADRSIHFTNLNKFLRWFCINISRQLRIPHEIDEYWDEEGMGSKVSCTTYFEEYLLTQSANPLVLCLDDVDLLFPYPEIYEDFFGLLRSWYEKARSRKLWQKLRLVILHSTDVYIQLNINQSPFNVGLPIELPEFTKEQVVELAQQHGLEASLTFLEPLIELVGGHPYLLELTFAHLKSHPDMKLERILAEAPTEAGIYRNHLWDYWLNLQERLELAATFKQVVDANSSIQIEPLSAYQLQSMGLVKLSGNKVQPRCNLYRQYFQMRLGKV
jgi:AAA-like domain